MYTVLHAFILWNKEWVHGSLTVVSDSTAVVNGLTNKSIKGPPLQPLRTILLMAAVLDIEIKARWIPSEENVIADAASRHDFKKLANLGFKDQVQMLRNKPSAAAKTSDLCCQLYNYFSSRLPQAHEETMSLSGEPTKSSVQVGTIPHIQRPSSQLPIGSPQILPNPSRQLLSKDTSMHCAHTTLKMASPTLHSPTRELTSSSEGERGYTGKENVEPDNHSQKMFF